MTEQYKERAYGVTMSVTVASFPGCCGGRTLYAFTVDGKYQDLTVDQKKKMYDGLGRKAFSEVPGAIVSMDCVLDFGEWDDLHRGTGTSASSWAVDEDCGDISLEDFCKYHGFDFTAHSINRNSGNIVGVMSKAIRKAPDGRGDAEVYIPPAPDYSDDETAEKRKASESANREEVIRRLREAVAAAQGA